MEKTLLLQLTVAIVSSPPTDKEDGNSHPLAANYIKLYLIW
ncbi:hypothetical protein [Bacillus sp. B1-b2]|nr:hypothetical protein [Bacillus sp. B1-b2]